MLAATKRSSGHLDLLTLALDLLSSGQRDVPTQVREHMWNVLNQALRLADQTRSIGPDVLAESADLALLIRRDAAIRQLVDEITARHAVEPAQATRLLNALT